MLVRSQKLSEKYHMVIHVLFAFSALLPFYIFEIRLANTVIWITPIVALLPDIEHLVFFGTYGRKSSYTQEACKVLQKQGFKALIKHLSKSHKTLTSLYLHNGLTMILFFALGVGLFTHGIFTLSYLCLILTSHYLYDILEDLLINGKVNPNWVLKFNRPSSR
jgi:hypothetical protein